MTTTDRTRHRRRLRGAAAAVVLAASIGFAPGVAGAYEPGTISISPTSGPVGTEVTITGTLPTICTPDSPMWVDIGELFGHELGADGSTRSTQIGAMTASDWQFSITATIPATIGADADGVGVPAGQMTYPVNSYCYNRSLSSNPIEGAATTFTIADELSRGTIGVASTTVTAGAGLSFTADGFAPDSEVTVELHSDPVDLGTVTADAAGHVAATVTIPADVPAGDHTLVLSGTGADGEPLELRTPINVTAPEPSTDDSATPGDTTGATTGATARPAAPVTARPDYNG